MKLMIFRTTTEDSGWGGSQKYPWGQLQTPQRRTC